MVGSKLVNQNPVGSGRVEPKILALPIKMLLGLIYLYYYFSGEFVWVINAP